VGPRRTDIHVLAALSPHPCGSAHCASSAFGLHPSRVGRRLGFLCTRVKIKININSFPAEAGPTKEQRVYPEKVAPTSTVGPALAGKLLLSLLLLLLLLLLIVPTLRVVMPPQTLCVLRSPISPGLRGLLLIAPTLRVGMPPRTLCVLQAPISPGLRGLL
jgi:hypothetical protein